KTATPLRRAQNETYVPCRLKLTNLSSFSIAQHRALDIRAADADDHRRLSGRQQTYVCLCSTALDIQSGPYLEPISKLLAAVDTLYRWNDSAHGRTVGTHSGSFSGGAHCRWSSWTQTNSDAARA